MSSNAKRPPLCGLTDEQVDALQAKLDPANVRQREGKFDYIEAHHAIREANRIFGPGGWTRDSSDMQCIFAGEYAGKNKSGYIVCYICRVTVNVRTEDGWIASDGWGYGESIGYGSLGQCYEGAVKEAESDAMKRALVKFGDPFGLALYDKERENVASPPPPTPPGLDEKGNPLNLVGLANAMALDGTPKKFVKPAAALCEFDWDERESYTPEQLQAIRIEAHSMWQIEENEKQEAVA